MSKFFRWVSMVEIFEVRVCWVWRSVVSSDVLRRESCEVRWVRRGVSSVGSSSGLGVFGFMEGFCLWVFIGN